MRGKKRGGVRVARSVDPYVSSSGWLMSYLYIVLLLNKLSNIMVQCDDIVMVQQKFGYGQTKGKRILEWYEGGV